MAKDKIEIPPPEWSVQVEEQTITSASHKMNIAPDAAEMKQLAKRLAVLSLDDLKVELILKRQSAPPAIHVRGKLKAHVSQTCVITGEPLKNKIQEEFEAWFSDRKQAASFAKARHEKIKRTAMEEAPLLDEREDPEPIIDGRIDVGELAIQYLCLAIDLYPHAEGAVLPPLPQDKSQSGDPHYKNPFAALKDWKDKIGSDKT